MVVVMRQISRIVTTLLFFASVSSAQGGSPNGTSASSSPTRILGSYKEMELDLEVKVQGGEIRVERSWQGDRGSWLINPQHERLKFDELESGRFNGNHELPKIIRRGTMEFKLHSNADVYQLGTGVGESTAANVIGAAPNSLSILISQKSINYCAAEEPADNEYLVVNSAGYKWVIPSIRHWAQYDWNGRLKKYGKGNFVVAKVLYDGSGDIKGYADRFDNQVITYTRNNQNRITQVSDYSGRQVNYSYVGNQIEEVENPEGRKTKYVYTDNNITQKIIGSGSGINNKTQIDFTYGSNKRLISKTDGDGIVVNYSYNFDANKKTFTTTQIQSGNITTKTVQTMSEGLRSIERNGEYSMRRYKLCEDEAYYDRSNRLTYIDRDHRGFTRRIISADGKQVSFEYLDANWSGVDTVDPDSTNQEWGLSKITLASGIKYIYERNNQGLATSLRVELSNSGGGDNEKRYWQMEYDQEGNLTQIRSMAKSSANDLQDVVVFYNYDQYGNISEQSFLDGAQWRYNHDSSGQLAKVIAPLGETIEFAYDSQGNLLNYQAANGYQESYSYSNRGLLTSYTEIYSNNAAPAITQLDYNHRGLLTKVTDPLGFEWEYQYDEQGNLISEKDPQNRTMQYGYDVNNRISQVIDGNGTATSVVYFDTVAPPPPNQFPGGFVGPTLTPSQSSYAFEPVIRIVFPGGKFYRDLKYNKTGQLITDSLVPTNPNSGDTEQITQYEYDEDRRLIRTIRPDGLFEDKTYDLIGRLASMTEPGKGTTTISYPEGDRKVVYEDGVGGITQHIFSSRRQLTQEIKADGSAVNYQYDLNGNLLNYINSRGQVIQYNYDPAFNIIGYSIHPSVGAAANKSVSLPRNLRGDLLGYNDGLTSQTISRDIFGRTSNVSTNYGAFTKAYSYTYTGAGDLASYTNIDGVVQSYGYDMGGYFANLSIPGQGNISTPTDSVSGNKEFTQFPGGNRQEYTYDSFNRIKKIQSKNSTGTNTYLDYQYSYINAPANGMGLISSIQTEHGTYNYTYGNAFRLVAASYPDGSHEFFDYDAIGRRSPLGGTPWVYNANGALLSTGTESYTYDADGNRITKTEGVGTATPSTTHYFYDTEDRLLKIEKPLGTVVATYEYDAFNRRISKTVGSGINAVKTYFHYNEDGLAAELDSQGVVQRKYHFAPDGMWGTNPLAIEQGGNLYQYHNDHLGTPQQMRDGGGGLAWEGRYKAFGKVNVLSGGASGVSNNLRFPGQFEDGESGLYYNYFRSYDPGVGAYLQFDPIGIRTGYNRYLYVRANPLGMIDPWGLEPEIYTPETAAAIREMLKDSVMNRPPVDTSGRLEPPDPFLDPLDYIAGGAAAGLGGKIGKAGSGGGANEVPLSCGGDVFTKEVQKRLTKGKDGGVSEQVLERVNGEFNSRLHRVEINGKIVHQHMDHTGKYGTVRQFPSEWTGVKVVNID